MANELTPWNDNSRGLTTNDEDNINRLLGRQMANIQRVTDTHGVIQERAAGLHAHGMAQNARAMNTMLNIRDQAQRPEEFEFGDQMAVTFGAQSVQMSLEIARRGVQQMMAIASEESPRASVEQPSRGWLQRRLGG